MNKIRFIVFSEKNSPFVILFLHLRDTLFFEKLKKRRKYDKNN